MTKRLISVLLLSAALPLTAIAQTGSGEAGTTITNPGTPADQNAQSPNDPDAGGHVSDATATTAGPFVTVPETGAWRVSDFEGKAVYSTDGENIGSISDVLVSQNGSMNAVIIGVGGFLGIAEKNVAVDISALQLGPGASQSHADAVSAATPEAAPGDVSGETTASTETEQPATGAETGMVQGADPDLAAENPGTPVTGDDQQMAANDSDGAIRIGPDGLPERIVLNVTRQQLEEAPAFEGLRGETEQQQ